MKFMNIMKVINIQWNELKCYILNEMDKMHMIGMVRIFGDLLGMPSFNKSTD